jgi:protein ImuB
VFVSSIVCVLVPRFELVVAAGGRAEVLSGPAALAPEPGREQKVGEVSEAAEGFGIHAGMRMGEALARCPRLALVPPDPLGVADAWERVLERLEAMGARVEPGRPGLACFDARGLRRLHGGSLDGVLAATRAALSSPVRLAPRAERERASGAVRLGAGPSRFCAIVAAASGSGHVAGARDLAASSVALLRHREELAVLPVELERLGIATLGELAAVPRGAMADRFGRLGLLAHDLAAGNDSPLRPRRPGELLEETLELEESSSGVQLGRALELLVDRLLARRERDGRTLRVVVLGATLVEGGTWRERMVFREPLADPLRMRLALAQRLALLPAPAERLRLSVERFGPPHAEGATLWEGGAERRRARLREAIRQVRATAGPEGALRALPVDPDSRVPERRVVLAPFEA